MSPIFNITENQNVTSDSILIYAIRESDGLTLFISPTEDQFKLKQDNTYEIDIGKISSQLQPGEYTLHIFGVNVIIENLLLTEISNSRYELRLSSNTPDVIPSIENLYRNYDLRVNDVFYPILSSVKDIDETLILKLFTPLQDSVNEGVSDVSICTHVFDPIIVRVKIEKKEGQQFLTYLPNASEILREQSD